MTGSVTTSVLVAGARTPIGKLSGALSQLSASDLASHAIAGALGRAGIDPESVDHVILGHVVQAGAGPQIARKAAYDAGIPLSTPTITLNKLCLSGLQAIIQADQLIRLGLAEVVVAGGTESMTNAAYLLRNARAGYRFGDGVVADSLMHDGLVCGLENRVMGEATDRYASAEQGLDRDRQDVTAAMSHARAGAARDSGRFDAEISPIALKGRKGDVEVAVDEGVRDGIEASDLAALRPAFVADGTITAGNASQISDGAAAMVVMSAERARRQDLPILAEIVSYGMVAGPDPSLLHQPARAARAALARAELGVADVDVFEINEAFAAVSLAAMDDLGVPDDIVNVNGGAIALGHPVGASGARLALTLAHELVHREGRFGIAALCGGGGQGDAILLRRAT